MEKEKIYHVELLTPSFCKIEKNKPEIRGTSIRGMIRMWAKLCRQSNYDIDDIWGGKGAKASKVGVNVKIVDQKTASKFLLPHKGDKGGTKQKAISEGSTFDLVLTRLVGCTDHIWSDAKKDVENWLLLGCLGQRANRAAGSVWCEEVSTDRLNVVNNLKIKIFSKDFEEPEEVRITASDTKSNQEYFGSYKPRIPSPIKMKVIPWENTYRMLWVSEKNVDMSKALSLLKSKYQLENWMDMEFMQR